MVPSLPHLMLIVFSWLIACVVADPLLSKVRPADALSQLVVTVKSKSIFTQGPSIFTQGKLSPKWNSTCLVALSPKSKLNKCVPLHTLGIYTDVLTIEYTFEDASLYEFGKPLLSTKGGRAQGIIDDFSTDVEQKRGEVRIEHRCRRLPAKEETERARRFRGDIAALRRADTSLVALRMQVTRGAWVVFGWQKVCGHGKHHALDYGVELRGGTARSLREVPDISATVVGPDSTTTRVYFRAERGAGAPRFSTPHVSVRQATGAGEDEEAAIDADVRAWETSLSGARFVVLYDCGGPGRAVVHATVAIPPFDNVTMAWTKDCGGGAEPSLRVVATQGLPSDSVAARGTASTAFHVDAHATRANTVLHEDEVVAFAVETRPGVHIGAPSVDAADRSVLRPRLHRRSISYMRSVGNKRAIVIALRCRKVGLARLRVTVPVQDRAPTEWVFFKRCLGPQEMPPVQPYMFFSGGLILVVLFIISRIVCADPGKPRVLFEKVERDA